MKIFGISAATAMFAGLLATPAAAQDPYAPISDSTRAVVRELVSRLELDRYKETIRGLTQFGDRRQGTDRNRAAVDWIEAQLKSYGCTNTERIKYTFDRQQLRPPGAANPGRAGGAGNNPGRAGGQRGRGANQDPIKGTRVPTPVNTNPEMQPDLKLRELNSQPDTPGPREEVYCTKIGTTHPNEMYIIGGHMDGHGFGTAANDDASGTALVMELARILHMPGVQTDRSIRFILFNNEETGGGAAAYVRQRLPLQGIEEPAGSGKYPEPKWLGMIQHDMMMWDHGAPGPDGKVSPEQRREADVNIEFAGRANMAAEAQKLAWFFRVANDRFATDYPAAVGDRMSNTDSGSFQDHTPSISLRENERLAHTGSGWNPTWHQPIDVMETFSDKDFRLGLNAAQTTLAAIAQLAGATIKP